MSYDSKILNFTVWLLVFKYTIITVIWFEFNKCKNGIFVVYLYDVIIQIPQVANTYMIYDVMRFV